MAESDKDAVRERPILFSAPMVRAILEGRKSQTRRVVKFRDGRHIAGNPEHDGTFEWWPVDRGDGVIVKQSRAVMLAECPHGQPGDRLWVRETALAMSIAGGPVRDVMYSDHEDYDICHPTKGQAFDLGWRVVPSIHMPRCESRLSLEVTDVRVERLCDLTEADAVAEGYSSWAAFQIGDFAGEHWQQNPWVWVISFRPLTALESLAPAEASVNSLPSSE